MKRGYPSRRDELKFGVRDWQCSATEARVLISVAGGLCATKSVNLPKALGRQVKYDVILQGTAVAEVVLDICF